MKHPTLTHTHESPDEMVGIHPATNTMLKDKSPVPDDIDNSEDLDEEAKYLGGIIKRVSNFDMGTLGGRKRFQKTVYLIQAFGINLKYEYNWYLHGVYSPKLADVGYRLSELYDDISVSQFSNAGIEKRFQKFLEYIEPIKNDTENLMIASSLHFLRENNPDLHRDQLIEFLLEEKELNDEKFEKCVSEWERLRDYDVIE